MPVYGGNDGFPNLESAHYSVCHPPRGAAALILHERKHLRYIGTDTKCAIACPSDDGNPKVRIIPEILKRLAQFLERFWVDGIQGFGTIYGNVGDLSLLLIDERHENLLLFLSCFKKFLELFY
jgi:hypothetical protein